MIYFIVIYAVLKLYVILDIYQQSHYEIKSYFSYFLFNSLFYDLCPLVCLIFSSVLNKGLVDIICGIYIILFSTISFILKVRLKFTKRIIRLIIMSIMYILLVSTIKHINAYLLLFIEFSIIPLFSLERVISNLINNKYINSARSKIESYSGKKIIITGSYGKTSTKSLMSQVLAMYKSTIAPPKSYNTPLGLSSFINANVISAYDNLILEFGASKVNDISSLLKIAKPDVAIVTEIGYMHMNSFKTIENVIKEKMKLIEEAEIAILNYDNEYIRSYPKNNKVILSYGFYHGDYNARNVNAGSFDLFYKNEFIFHLNTNLVGKHQLLNFLAVVAYIHYLKYDLSILTKGIKLIKLEEKRLELKRIGNRTILDDSFNSNLVGFKSALNYLKAFNGKRILITPGIVELGKYKNMINEELSLYIAGCSDIVILVGKKEIDNLYNCLKKFNVEMYRVATFIDGYELYLKLAKMYESSTVLIENDLPDLYKRRLLF